MFAYCNNNPIILEDHNGKDPIAISIGLGLVIGLSIAIPAAFYFAWELGANLADFITSSRVQISNAQKATEPETPDVTYPGNDPQKAPDGYEWKGKGEQGEKGGNYYNKDTGESLGPDLDHPDPIGPHWDYNYRGSGVKGWRIFPNGEVILKK